MEINIKENGIWVLNMEKEFLNILMVKLIQEIGIMIKNKEQEF